MFAVSRDDDVTESPVFDGGDGRSETEPFFSSRDEQEEE